MIVKMKKYLFMGPLSQKDLFFHRAQDEGCIEFLLEKKGGQTGGSHIETLIQAIKILEKIHTKKGIDQPISPEAVVEVSEEVLQLKKLLDNSHEEAKMLQCEREKVAPFGSFSPSDIEELKRSSLKEIQFFKIPLAECKENLGDEIVEIKRTVDAVYAIRIGPTFFSHKKWHEVVIERSLREIDERRSIVSQNIQNTEKKLSDLTCYLPLLKTELLGAADIAELKKAKKGLKEYLDGSLFAIEGWVPKTFEPSLIALAEGMGLHFEEVPIQKGEEVPTHMENRPLQKIGEDLVHIYDTPDSKDKDPSGWVLWAFSLFFAMVISDAGYGILYLGLALFMRWKLFPKMKKAGQRLTHLLSILSCFCIGWGFFTGSYFGIELPPNHPLKEISPLQKLVEKKAKYHIGQKDDVYKEWIEKYPSLDKEKDPKAFLLKGKKVEEGITSYPINDQFSSNFLLEFSLLVGICHISLSFIRRLKGNIAGMGWVFFMIGGYLYFPSILDATSIVHVMGLFHKEVAYQLGWHLLIGGVISAVVIALIQKRSIGELFESIQVFADVLSYLRLYALGLAGMIMASTFNNLAASAGWLFGFFILLIGHITNIVLGIMGGVIHGLRLNFLEWYHYSFDGGGRLFRPLRRLKKESE